MIETMWVKTADGLTTGARHKGGRGSVVIFVHGVGSTAAVWDPQLEALGNAYRCFAVELRGNGAGDDPVPEQITREGFVEDVLAIADAALADHFHFVGCSLGGVVGFELMRRVPHSIASLTLVGTFAAYPDAQTSVHNIIEAVTQAGDLRSFATARAARVVPASAPPERLSETVEQMAVKSLPSYIASTKATWTGDYRADLPGIRVPTLVVCGELDPIAPPAMSREIAEGVPGAKLTIVPEAGHVTNADAPEKFNALLTAFLESTETSG